MKKYITKFTIDILPSVFATVVGAYIVNYYIIPKAREDRTPAAAVVTAPNVKQPHSADAKPAETSPDITEAPVRKAAEKTDKPEPAKSLEKASDSRRHSPAREKDKAVAKVELKAEPKSEAKAETLVPAAPAPVATSVSVDDRRDANDLARAAIERLSRGEPKAQDALRASEASRAPERTALAQPQFTPTLQPVQQAQPMQQLPPPIVVSSPSVENLQPTERAETLRGPRPPGDVPVPLRADAGPNGDDRRGGRTNVAEDVLSAAKSMFDKVIPKQFER